MQPLDLISPSTSTEQGLREVYRSNYGILYQGDCLTFLGAIPNYSVDLVFADPPFNLGKQYGKNISDRLESQEYLEWSNQWLSESIRVLKPGGSLFVFNLPKWCIEYGAYLNRQGNELAPIMLERIIAMASNPGQIVIDPFGGSGTTFYAAQKLHRYWLGTEIGHVEPAVKRLTDLANGQIEEWESARGKKNLKTSPPDSGQLQLDLF